MKKHDLLKILGIIILAYVILTWFIDASYYSGFLQVVDKTEIGLGYLLNVPFQTLGYFSYIFIFILGIGSFYELLNVTGLYRKTLDFISKKLKNHKLIALIVTTILISLISSFTGLEIGMLFIFPFVISLIILLGYDKLTALLATIGATITGMIGSTYSYNAYGIVNDTLGITYSDGIIVKLILLLLSTALLIGFMLLHLKNTKDLKALNKEAMILVPEKKEVKKEKNKKLWPIITIILATILILILGTINWSSVFEITLFEDILTKITEITIFDYSLFEKLLGGISSFGSWNGPSKYIYFSGTLLIFSIVIAIVYKINFDDYIDSIARGAKNNLKGAILTIIAYILLIFVSSFPVFLTITQKITGETFNVATTGILNLFGSMLYVDLYYYPQYVLEYFASFKNADANVLSVLFVSTYSIIMLIAPTSILLLNTLQNTSTKYVDWIKFIWKLFVALLLVIFIVLLIYFVI